MSVTKGTNPVTGTVEPEVETPVVEAPEVEVPEVEVPEPVVVFEGDTVTIDGVLVDRKKLDGKLVGKFKGVETTFGDIAELILVCQEAKVWLDPKVTDENGKAFKNWATYLSNRLSKYPLANKALSKTMVEALLKAGSSQRNAAQASNKSLGYVHSVSNELKGKDKGEGNATGKGKRAARPNDGTPEQDEAGLASTPATEGKKIATQAVNALLKADDAVGDMAPADRDRVIEAAKQTLAIFKKMVEIDPGTEADAPAA